MERQGAEGGVVGVGEVVDDGVEGVAADGVVFAFCTGGLVTGRGREWEGGGTHWLLR